MERKLKAALAQYEASNGRPQENTRKIIESMQEAASQGADVICFPELFYSGYDIDQETIRRTAITRTDQVFQKLRQLAEKEKIDLFFSYPERDKDSVYISAAFIDKKKGTVHHHRKTYLWGKENQKVSKGRAQYQPFTTSYGQSGILICYEIEFPEPARILTLQGAEIIFVTAAFDTVTNFQKYLSAIAIHNQVYVIGMNGVNTNTEPKRGGSCVVNQSGETLFAIDPGASQLGFFEINLDKGNRRNREPHRKDIRRETLQILSELKEWKS